MNKTYYVCKYTPIELLEAFGGECQNLNERKGKGTGAGQLL